MRNKVRGGDIYSTPAIPDVAVPQPGGIPSLAKLLLPLLSAILPIIGATAVKHLLSNKGLNKKEEKKIIEEIKKIEPQIKTLKPRKFVSEKKKSKGGKQKKPIGRMSLSQLSGVLGAGIIEM